MKYTSKHYLRLLQEVNNLTEHFGITSSYKWPSPASTRDGCLALEGAKAVLTELYNKRKS